MQPRLATRPISRHIARHACAHARQASLHARQCPAVCRPHSSAQASHRRAHRSQKSRMNCVSRASASDVKRHSPAQSRSRRMHFSISGRCPCATHADAQRVHAAAQRSSAASVSIVWFMFNSVSDAAGIDDRSRAMTIPAARMSVERRAPARQQETRAGHGAPVQAHEIKRAIKSCWSHCQNAAQAPGIQAIRIASPFR